jgi:hypothetical protein
MRAAESRGTNEMIISHQLRYVYIGIPRNASKSVSQWLANHYKGEWHGYHHQWRVPEEAKDYLIFTVVRNPYERSASGTFAVLWNGEKPDPSKRVPSKKPEPSGKPLEERLREAELVGNATTINEGTNVPENGMNQSHHIKKAGVSLALYFERLPQCLADLPFVDAADVPPLPRALEKGIRPSGSFFDHFTDDDEQVTWAYASEDFETLGYKRYDASLPEDSPNSIRL